MSELKSVPLASISMIRNYRDVEPVSDKSPDIIELSESIKKHGVMQPALLRPGKKKDSYELIFGHRRFTAAKLAGLETIPANIKEVADDDILELQVTENLQRKDVHPMDEAVAFKSLIEGKKYKVEEIALRFAKKPEFVAQRLKLNDLIPEAQKEFKSNKLLLGHAILLARLTQVDQKDIVKEREHYGTVSDLNDYIERNIEHDLAKASFDIKDATIFPQAGACINCPKKSGNAALLFPDIKSPDRCFDSKCFEIKQDKAFMINLKNVVETQPEIKLAKERYNDLPKEVNNYLQKMKVTVLDSNSYSSSQWGDYKIKAKAFFLNGWQDTGKIKTVYLKGKVKGKPGEVVQEDSKAIIAGINERSARAKVLDSCKVHHAIIEAVRGRKEMIDMPYKMMPIDRGIMIFLIMHVAGLQRDKVKGIPEMPEAKGYKPDYFIKLAELPDDKLAMLIRIVIRDRFANENLQWGPGADDTPVRLIAGYLGIDIASIEAAQKEIADKRDARAKQRIDALKPKKPVAKKPIKKFSAKATA